VIAATVRVIGATIPAPDVDWLALSPSLALLVASGLCLLGAVLFPGDSRRLFSVVVALTGFVAAGVLAGGVYEDSPDGASLLADSMTRDRLGALAQVILAGVGVLVVLVSHGDRRRDHVGEYYALLTAAGAGMLFFVTAGNLMTLFLGLEWLSIALYVLCALDTHRTRSLEAGLKYLIVGSFGSAILLFGSALVYGATGELGFDQIRAAPGADDPLFVTGLALILAGLAFKVSAAPFHMWTPDVYQGAATPVTAFMAAATKAAAIVVTWRVLVTAFPEQSEIWTVAVAALAVTSLVVGNLAALVQSDVKRLLAYSSISQAGFLLIAVAAGNAAGGEALLYFLIPYTAATVGAFAVIAARERELDRDVSLDALAGLGWERPLHGAAMWVFMLSFAGFPLTGGFLGKFTVFSAAYESGWWWLVVIGVIATAVSVAYYLSVVRALYMRPAQVTGSTPVAVGGSPPVDHGLDAALVAAVVVVVGSFFFVEPLFELAEKAIAQLPL
jgi:NADH-quinone oxidoreductase subunit N